MHRSSCRFSGQDCEYGCDCGMSCSYYEEEIGDENRAPKFLTGRDYPDLCATCRGAITAVAMLFEEGALPDTNDPEAPIMYVYDHKMYCGGYTCLER